MSNEFRPILKVKSSSSKKEKTPEKKSSLREIKSNLYREAYHRKVGSFDLKGAALNGVKYINLAPINTETSYLQFHILLQDAFDIQFILSQLTPKQFENLFPIIKEYNGNKYQCKDYWSTKEYLSTIPENKPIGENIDEFLWNYYNNDIIGFSVKMYLCVDRLRKIDGKKSMMEEFADMFGVPTYTIDRENDLIKNNKTGEVFETTPPDATKIKNMNSSKEDF